MVAPSQGDHVKARFRGGKRFFPGTVRSVHKDGTFSIDYDDGDKEECVPLEFIASSDDDFHVGDKILARFRGKGPEYPGKVSKVHDDGTIDVEYNDGDVDDNIPSSAARLQSPKTRSKNDSAPFSRGDKVMCRFRGMSRGKEFPGKIVAVNVNDETVDVDYDDGDKDRGISWGAARKLEVCETETSEEDSDESGDEPLSDVQNLQKALSAKPEWNVTDFRRVIKSKAGISLSEKQVEPFLSGKARDKINVSKFLASSFCKKKSAKKKILALPVATLIKLAKTLPGSTLDTDTMESTFSGIDAEAFDVEDDVKPDGSRLFYYVSTCNIGLNSKELLDALDEFRKLVCGSVSQLKAFRKAFEKIDVGKTGSVETKAAKQILQQCAPTISKKWIDILLRNGLIRIDESFDEDNESSTSEDEEKYLNKKSATLSGKKRSLSLQSWRVKSRSSFPDTFNYIGLLGFLCVPSMRSEGEFAAHIQSIFLHHPDLLASWNEIKKPAPFVQFCEETEYEGIPITREEIARLCIASEHSLGNIIPRKIAKWVSKNCVLRLKVATAFFKKELPSNLQKVFGRSSLKQEEKDSSGEEGENDVLVTRSHFISCLKDSLSKKYGLQTKQMARVVLMELDPRRKGKINLTRFTQFMKEDEDDEEDLTEKDEVDSTEEEENEDSSVDSCSESGEENTAANFLSASFHKSARKTVKRIRGFNSDGVSAILRILKEKRIEELLRDDLQISETDAKLLEQVFEEDESSFSHFLAGVGDAMLENQVAIQALLKLVERFTVLVKESKLSELLNPEQALKAKVKAFLQAQNAMTKEELKKLLEMKDEEEIIHALAKRFKLKPPPLLLRELRKISDSGECDCKKALHQLSKIFRVKLSRAEMEALLSHFGERLKFGKLIPFFKSNDATKETKPLMKRCLECGKIDFEIFLEAFFGNKGKNVNKVDFVGKLMRLRLPLTNSQILSVANRLAAENGNVSKENVKKWCITTERSEKKSSLDSDGSLQAKIDDSSSAESYLEQDQEQPHSRRWFGSLRKAKLQASLRDVDSDEEGNAIFGALSRRFQLQLKESLATGSSLRSLHEGFASADSKKSGFVSGKAFAQVLKKALSKPISKKDLSELCKLFGFYHKFRNFVRYTDFMALLLQNWISWNAIEEILETEPTSQRSLRRALASKAKFIKESSFWKIMEENGVVLRSKKSKRELSQFCDPAGQGMLYTGDLIELLARKVDTKLLQEKLRYLFQRMKEEKKFTANEISSFRMSASFQTVSDLGNVLCNDLGLALSPVEVWVLWEVFESKGKVKMKEFGPFFKGRGNIRHHHKQDAEGTDSEDSQRQTDNEEGGNTKASPSQHRKGGPSSSSEDETSESEKQEAEEDCSSTDLSENSFDISDSEGDSLEAASVFRKKRRNRQTNPSHADPEYIKALDKSLKKAFDAIDLDRNGVIDQRELGRALLALGRECSEDDVAEVMREHDLDHDGKLSKKEFVLLAVNIITAKDDQLASLREKDIAGFFQRMDSNGDGTVSSSEFRRGIRLLCGDELSDTEVAALLRIADIDGDGSVTYEEFISLLKFGSRMTKRDAVAENALRKVIRGPVPDPTKYLNLFARTPSNYRPALLAETDTATELTSAALLSKDPLYSGNGSRSSDSRRSSRRNIDDKHVLTLQISLKQSRGVPVIADEKIARRVIERKAKICLWRKKQQASINFKRSDAEEIVSEEDTSAEGECSDFEDAQISAISVQPISGQVGNQYAIKAIWDPTEEDVWTFSSQVLPSGSRRLATFYARIPENLKNLCQAKDETLCLLVELTLVLRSGSNPSLPPTEMGCGWCAFELGELERAAFERKEIRVALMGGSPENPFQISREDIRSGKKGWRAFKDSFRRPETQSFIRLQCQSGARTGRSAQRALALLPSPIIIAQGALPLIMTYQDIREDMFISNDENDATIVAPLAKREKSGSSFYRSRQDGDHIRFKPVLRIFPEILSDADLLQTAIKRWNASFGSQLRDSSKRRAAFEKVVLGMWPLLCAVERKSAVNLMSPNARKFKKVSRPSTNLFFSAMPDTAIPKSGSRRRLLSISSSEDLASAQRLEEDATLLFKPFNIKETIV